jgi:hypothetical protein
MSRDLNRLTWVRNLTASATKADASSGALTGLRSVINIHKRDKTRWDDEKGIGLLSIVLHITQEYLKTNKRIIVTCLRKNNNAIVKFETFSWTLHLHCDKSHKKNWIYSSNLCIIHTFQKAYGSLNSENISHIFIDEYAPTRVMKAMQSLDQILKRCIRYTTGQISKPIGTNNGYKKRYCLLPTLYNIEVYISGFQDGLTSRDLERRVPSQNEVMEFSSKFTGRINLTDRIVFSQSFI